MDNAERIKWFRKLDRLLTTPGYECYCEDFWRLREVLWESVDRYAESIGGDVKDSTRAAGRNEAFSAITSAWHELVAEAFRMGVEEGKKVSDGNRD